MPTLAPPLAPPHPTFPANSGTRFSGDIPTAPQEKVAPVLRSANHRGFSFPPTEEQSGASPASALLVRGSRYSLRVWLDGGNPPTLPEPTSPPERGLRNEEEGFLLFYLLCIWLIQQLLEENKFMIKYHCQYNLFSRLSVHILHRCSLGYF